MNSHMEAMAALQRLIDLGLDKVPARRSEVEALRAAVPAPILGHFDRNVACGRKGFASVIHGICSGCHLRVAVGTVAMLKGTSGLVLCENCAAYLHYIPELPATSTTPAAPGTKRGVGRPVSRRVNQPASLPAAI